MAKAREVFKPIPTAAPQLPGNAASPAKIELGKMLYFDPRLSASHAIRQLQLLPQYRYGRRGRRTHVSRAPLAAWRTQRADRAQRRVQCGPVLGRSGQGPRAAGGRADGQSGRDGLA